MKMRLYSEYSNTKYPYQLCGCGYRAILSAYDDNVYCFYCKRETFECACDKEKIEREHEERLRDFRQPPAAKPLQFVSSASLAEYSDEIPEFFSATNWAFSTSISLKPLITDASGQT